MITGKCEEDFLTYFKTNRRGTERTFYELPELLQNALIIEFLDNIKYEGKPIFSHCFNLYWTNRVSYQTHNDICLQSIEMCNKFYNEINKETIKT